MFEIVVASLAAGGTFVLPAVPNGSYRLRIELGGYQPTDSTSFTTDAAATVRLTLAI